MTKLYVHFNEVKLRRRMPSHTFIPPTRRYGQPQPPPQSANHQGASSLQTQHWVEVNKRVYSKNHLWGGKLNKTKHYTVVQKCSPLHHQQDFFFFLNISFSPITQTNPINKKANIKLAFVLEGAATYFLVLPTVNQCFFVFFFWVL